ncbi:unnamed protein product [Clonostachys rosea f. rosea IK726]|uniref:Uncharacterized protein n=1 Tax=Clonostachys rosea f. rosea IK726 TaxID=1349383 RepID=A0ACA9UCE3_BIOOC|nr:unnamed protein product [Clonostachys rosea f. rosea IK726]
MLSKLSCIGVALTGGRDADVGIGGFLTGGGNAYLTARTGFGCDTVVNFEVVLANGTIVNANKTANADLWRALKGGWANFGVVTRFDIETTAAPEFTNENEDNPEAARLVLRTYNTVTPQGIGMITVMVDTKNLENAPVFNDIRAIPSTVATSQHTTLGQLAQNGIDPSDDRVHWFTLTFNNDIAILKKAMALHDALAADLKTTLGPAAFSTQCVLQPIPSFFGTIGARKGGNMLGLDAVKTNSILWLGTVAYKDPDHDKVAHKKLEKSFRELEKFAKSRNGNVEWLYINYADKTQNPLKSYGKANLDFMKNVAGTYDPKGVFRSRCLGALSSQRYNRDTDGWERRGGSRRDFLFSTIVLIAGRYLAKPWGPMAFSYPRSARKYISSASCILPWSGVKETRLKKAQSRPSSPSWIVAQVIIACDKSRL